MPSTKPPDRAILALPRAVQIEPVGHCNLRCPMCTVRFRRDGPPAFMDRNLFENIIDQFPSGTTLHLQGLGEPLLHPRFFEMVSAAVLRGFAVSTNSNMTVLDAEKAEACVRSGLSWIRISIDGATAETYESIRIGSSLSGVLRNIELLRQAKEKIGSTKPALYLVMVLMKRNLGQLTDMVRLAHRYGLEQVFVQHLCHDFAEEELPSQYRSMRAFIEAETLVGQDPVRIRQSFAEARSLAQELAIGIRLPPIDRPGARVQKQGRDRCDWPWRSLYISYDGCVMPCCTIGTPDRMSFGSAQEQPLSRIWNSEPYRLFRSRLDSDEPPSICRSCSIYKGIF